MSTAYNAINQKRIAMEAGVSQSTVSLVLAGRGLIAQRTRERVLHAAERLQYRPNLLVQGIQTGKTGMMGVMAPPFDSYWSEILYGIHDALAAADYVPVIQWAPHEGDGRGTKLNGDVSKQLDQIHRLLDRRVDGVILWPPFASLYSDHIHEFSSRAVPIVTIDQELPAEFTSAYVGSDEALGGRLVAEHLYGLGHRHVGHLSGPGNHSWAVRRREAFESAWGAMDSTTCLTVEATPGLPSLSMDQVGELVVRVPEISAIYAATDVYAKMVYRAAALRGLRIPEDFSVVGFADDDFAADLTPPLTTVRQAAYDIGRTAAEMSLRGVELGPLAESKEIAVSLQVRGSTGLPGKRHVSFRASGRTRG